jgi:Homeodomain
MRSPPVAMASQQYHQHQPMSRTQRTIPSSQTSTQLENSAEEIILPERAEPAEPVIKKKRKRADARQLEILHATYARTAFPSTDERSALAKELDMSARSIQIWLAYSLVHSVFMISELWIVLSGSRTKDSRPAKAEEILPVSQTVDPR